MDRIQLRRDTSARWAEINPILLEGEVGFETDTKHRKIGDGVHRWNELEYLKAENILQETGNSESATMSQAAITRGLNELGSEVGLYKLISYDKVSSVPYLLNTKIKSGETISVWFKLIECEGPVYILAYDSKTYIPLITTNTDNIGAWKQYKLINDSDNDINSLVVSSASSTFVGLIVEGNPLNVKTEILDEFYNFNAPSYSVVRLDKSNIKNQLSGRTNTLFYIYYEYDLKGDTLEIPKGCKLIFKGGIIKNGVIKGDINIVSDRIRIFDNITFDDSSNLLNSDIYTEWFGCKCDGVTDDTDSLQKAIDVFMSINIDNYEKSYNLIGGNHLVTNTIHITGVTNNYAFSHNGIYLSSVKADFEGYAVSLDGDINGFEINIGCLTNTGGGLTCGKNAGIGVVKLNGKFWRSTNSNVINLDASEGCANYINDVEIGVQRLGFGAVVLKKSNNDVLYHNTFEYSNLVVDNCFNTTLLCPHTSDKGKAEFIVETIGYCPSFNVVGGSTNTAWIDKDRSMVGEASTKWKFSVGTSGIIVSKADLSLSEDCYHSIINGRVLIPTQSNKAIFETDGDNKSVFVDTSVLNGKLCPTVFDSYEGVVNKIFLDGSIYGGKGKINQLIIHALPYESILIGGTYLKTYPANTDKWVRLIWDGDWFEQDITRVVDAPSSKYSFVKGENYDEITLDKDYKEGDCLRLRVKVDTAEGDMYLICRTKSNEFIPFATLKADQTGWKTFILKNENSSPIYRIVFSSASASGSISIRY